MNHKQITIVGGGLSGLYAAFLLEQQGINDYILLEARSSFGGITHAERKMIEAIYLITL